jgi:hypothetical protein
MPVGTRLAAALAIAGALLTARDALASAPVRSAPFAARLATARADVHARPSAASRTVRVLRRFRADFRPTVVLAIGSRRTGGQTWYRVRLAGRPNGRTGWVAARRLEWVRSVRRIRIVVDRSARRLTVLRGRRRIRSFPVAVGKRGARTPAGHFYLAAAWRPAEPLYGAWAIETSAGASITDWPGGGVIGIHGTNQPGLIGQAVSHGCIRMRNADILRLRRWARPGTRLRIV